MVVYLTLTIIVLILSLWVKNREYVAIQLHREGKAQLVHHAFKERQQIINVIVMFAIFMLLAAVSACRIAVGNDYWVYREQFQLIMQGRYVSYEWGFNTVVWIIQSIFGYDKYLPVFGVFSIATAFFLTKAMSDQAEWMVGTVFLLMTNGYYFLSLNSVRYYFVLSIVLFSMKYVLRKEYVKFILWILLAACFHKSVLVVIPFFLLARFLAERKVYYWIYVIGGIIAISLIAFPELYRRIIFTFYPFYENSAFDTGDFSITNIFKCLLTLGLSIMFYRTAMKGNIQNRFYYYLNLMGLVVYTCGSFIPEVSRIGYYFIISQIFLIPGIVIRIDNKRLRMLCVGILCVGFLGYFALLLRSGYDVSVRILPYLNWIFN